MSNSDKFLGSLTKLERANQLIDDLEAEFNKFNNGNPVEIAFDTTNNEPKIQANWKGLPRIVGSILGDVVHNLRSSLDLLAVELVSINGGNNKNVYFPFASSEGELEDMIKRKNFHRAGNEAIEIIKQIKPYHDGNVLLRALHDLDIDDKHKRLLDTEKRMHIRISLKYNLNNHQDYNLEYDCNTIEHLFENESNLSGKPVIDTLKEIHHEINNVVKLFQNHLK